MLSKFHRKMLRQGGGSPAFAIEQAEDGVALIACLAHIEPILTMLPLVPASTIRYATACVRKNNDSLVLWY